MSIIIQMGQDVLFQIAFKEDLRMQPTDNEQCHIMLLSLEE